MQSVPKYHDEASFLEDFKAGRRPALKQLYALHYRPLWAYAARILDNEDEAEDVVAEGFVKLWQRRQDFESFKKLLAFMYTVTRNACFNHLRAAKRRDRILGQLWAETDHMEEIEPLSAIEADLIQLSLLAAQDLPPQMKKIFEMVYLEGFSAAEAADKLQLSIHTIRAQRVNAVRRVKESLNKKGLICLAGILLLSSF